MSVVFSFFVSTLRPGGGARLDRFSGVDWLIRGSETFRERTLDWNIQLKWTLNVLLASTIWSDKSKEVILPRTAMCLHDKG